MEARSPERGVLWGALASCVKRATGLVVPRRDQTLASLPAIGAWERSRRVRQNVGFVGALATCVKRAIGLVVPRRDQTLASLPVIGAWERSRLVRQNAGFCGGLWPRV